MNLKSSRTQIAVLIDPDKTDHARIKKIAKASENAIDFFLVGGSLMIKNNLEPVIASIRKHTSKKIYLFPGNPVQISLKADGLLLLSLISGRNPDLLIGHHVQAAPILKASGLDIIPTGYILVDGGIATTVSYISNTTPVPAHKPEIAVCTAMAGELLGMKAIYLEAGSGAAHPVPVEMIRMVKNALSCPLIVGGGMRSSEQVNAAIKAGADVIVIGTAIEKDTAFLEEIRKIRK
jgi:putative glycerol-1-phosphate prenyltransferase